MLLLGLAMAHVFAPSQAATFASITSAATGRASTLFNASRQLGSAVGIVTLTTVIATIGTTHQITGHPTPQLSAYHYAFATAAALVFLAASLAHGIADNAAASTMRTRMNQTSQQHVAEAAAGPIHKTIVDARACQRHHKPMTWCGQCHQPARPPWPGPSPRDLMALYELTTPNKPAPAPPR